MRQMVFAYVLIKGWTVDPDEHSQTPSNVGVLPRIIFSHTPDEARSGGLGKACVPGKNYSVPEKIESLNE